VRRTRILLILILLSVLFITGCWDKRELSEVSIITGLAIDKGDKAKYKLTIESINAAELNEQTASGNTPSIIFSLEGNTIVELAHKMNVGFSKSAIYSHMGLVIVSEEIAKAGLMDFLDSLDRNREIRDDFNIVVAKGEKAEDILKVTYPLQKASSLKLHTQLTTAVDLWGLDPDVRINGLTSAFLSPGRQPVLTAVTIQGDPKKGGSVENMQNVQPDALVVIDSLALFEGNKLVGYLPVEDTRNYLWTQDKIRTTTISTLCDKEKDKYFTIRVASSNTHLDTKMKNGKPQIQIKIRIESYLSTDDCISPLDKPSAFEKYDNLAKQNIEHQIESTIKTVQTKYGIDIFGFGEEMERQDYKGYQKVKNNWDKHFKEAEIRVDADVNIRRAGLKTKGVKPE
jgi:spore germination protein KC